MTSSETIIFEFSRFVLRRGRSPPSPAEIGSAVAHVEQQLLDGGVRRDLRKVDAGDPLRRNHAQRGQQQQQLAESAAGSMKKKECKYFSEAAFQVQIDCEFHGAHLVGLLALFIFSWCISMICAWSCMPSTRTASFSPLESARCVWARTSTVLSS